MLARTRTLLVALPLLAAASIASAADITSSLTFVGITPCRIIDTRVGQGFTGQWGPPALVANTDRTFRITGTTGGIPTPCGIPTRARAISANFTVVNFAGAGDIRVGPAGSPLPQTSILNYRLENIANSTTVPLGPVAAEFGFTARADASGTDFVVDVNGYYVPNGALAFAFISGAGAMMSGTPNVTSTFNAGLTRYEITIAGETYFFSDYVTMVAPASPNLHWRVTSASGLLLVYFTDDTGAPIASNLGFQFVTFKP